MAAWVCLTVQSAVVAGHVGLGAAAPALALSGVEVWPLPTVTLSGHAATPGVCGRRATGPEIAALAEGLATGALARADAMLTGYIGAADAAEAVADLARDWRVARPGGLRVCDPVLGDREPDGTGPGLYLPAAVGEVHRARLLPGADLATPNVFELGWLTGRPVGTLAEIAAAAQALRGLGVAEVVVTSVSTGEAEAPHGALALMSVGGAGVWLAGAPRLPIRLNGAGDFVAALLTAARLEGLGMAEASARTVGAAHAAAVAAQAAGRDDLPVVAARKAWLAAPPAPLARLRG